SRSTRPSRSGPTRRRCARRWPTTTTPCSGRRSGPGTDTRSPTADPAPAATGGAPGSSPATARWRGRRTTATAPDRMVSAVETPTIEDMRRRPLVPLPSQPDGVPWPTEEWPRAEPPAAVAGRLAELVDEITTDTARYGTTYAAGVVHRRPLLVERYGGGLELLDSLDQPVPPHP